MESIKVPVSGDEGGNEAPKPKKIVKRPAARADEPKERRAKGGWLSSLVAIIVTALVVGGGIYAWQNRVGQDKVEGARQQEQEIKMTYEQRLESIKNSLTVAEGENSELKKQAEDFLSKLGLLKKARLDFSDPVFGFALSYPASLGDLTLTSASTTAGTKVNGTWSATEKVAMGGTDDKYQSAATSGPISLMDTHGFAKEKNEYFLLGPDGAKLAVKPSQIVAFEGGEAIVLDQKSFGAVATGTPLTDIGGNIAVVLNLKTGPVKGLAIVDTDFGVLSVDEMVEMVKSINIK